MLVSIARSLFKPLTDEDQAAAREVGHFFGIDLLRGLAAVAVVIWHYQFFFQAGPLKPTEAPADIDRTLQPLYWLFWPIYEHGYWAVQLFWMISGFVFAHIYAGRRTTLKDFALRRFARLYPLHLLTLVVIAALQVLSWHTIGGYQLASRNDAYHFALHLFMASQWGMQEGVSFNVPVWSVSVEEPVYLLFFFTSVSIFVRGVTRPLLLAVVAAILTHALHSETPKLFAMCVMFYYGGVCLYFAAAKLRQQRVLTLSAVIAGLAITLMLSTLRMGGRALPPYDIGFVLFGSVVLFLGVIGYRPIINTAASRLRWLGDATYSMYLWHFPVIVAVCIVRCVTGASDAVFYTPLTLLLWVVTMMAIGCASFHWIERPAQRFCLALPRLLARAKPPASLATQSKQLSAADPH